MTAQCLFLCGKRTNDKREVRQRENPISKSRMRKAGLSLRDTTPGSTERSPLKLACVLSQNSPHTYGRVRGS